MIYNPNMKPHPWKTPFREVYSQTFWQWLRSAWRCHVVLRFSRRVLCSPNELF